jgi:hypothetical protein
MIHARRTSQMLSHSRKSKEIVAQNPIIAD